MNPLLVALVVVLAVSMLATLLLYSARLIDLVQVRDAPYVPLDKQAIGTLLEKLPNLKGKVFYELGSGDGRVALEVMKKLKPSRCTAIEKGSWPMLIAHWKRLRFGSPRGLEFVKDDIRSINLRPANVIFAYLMDDFVASLKPKLQKELRPGTIFISCQFPLRGKRPYKTIEIEQGPVIASRLYFYRF
jgi:hypothetical protein